MRPRRPRWTGSPFRRRGNQPETLRLRALCQAGDAARDRRDWSEAARLYQEIVAIDPSQSNIIIQLGHAVKELGEYDRAAELYYTALRQKPDDDDLHLQIGHVEKLRSNIAEAVKHYKKSAEINPDNFDARREYAALSEPGLNFVNGGISPTREVSGKAGTAPGRGGRKNAAASRAAGDRARDERLWREAAAAYRAYLDQAPSDAAIWVQYGHSLKELGDLVGGEAAYRKALALYPDDADVHLQLGHILKLRDRRSAAIEAYRRSFQLKPLRSAALELERLGEILVEEAEALPAALREPQVFLDISDFFAHALDSSTISGIQRVQLGIISHVLEAHRKKDGLDCQVVVWGGELLWAVPDHLLRPMMAIFAAEDDDTDCRQRAKLVEDALAEAELVRPVSGDIVVATGVIYRRPNLLNANSRLRRAGVRLGAYIHDFIPLTHPEFCDRQLIDDFSPSMADALLQYAFVLTVSEHVGRELRRLLVEADYPALPIRVVTEAHGFDAVSDNGKDFWTPPIMALQGREFVLCVGTFSAQKNQALLLQIWRLLLRQGIEPPLLVLVGRPGQHSSELMSLLSASNRLDDRVHVLEGLTDGELATLYRNCLFTMFPSFVEGWGLPVGESLAYGKLCIASDAASLPEVAGDFALYIDPYNARGGADVVRRLLDDRAELHRLEMRIREEFKPRSWQEHGTALIAAIKELGRPGDGRSEALPRLSMPFGQVVRPFRITDGGWEYGTRLPPYREWVGHALRRVILESGWFPMESWGTWMEGRRGRLAFSVDQPQPQPVRLVLQFRAAPWARANLLSVRAGCGAAAAIPVPESVSHRETYPHFMLWLDCLPDEDGRIDLVLAVLGEIPEPWWGETREYCVGLRRVMCLDAMTADEPLDPYSLLSPRALTGPSGAAVVPSGSTSLQAALRRRRVLVEGWSEPEPWGAWMTADRARLVLVTEASAGEALGVVLKWRTLPGWRSEIVVRSACGACQTRLVPPGSPAEFSLWLDCRADDNGRVELQIDVARQSVDPSSDLRAPALGLSGIAYGRQNSTENRLDLAEAVLLGEADAGAAELRAALDAGLRFSVIGHIKGSYSLAAVNRRLALALEETRPGSVRIEQVEGQPTRDLSQIPNDERSVIFELAARPPYEDGPAVEIVQHWPLWVPPHPTDLKLAWVPWEESLVPRDMVRMLNDRFDGVLVQTRFVAKALIDSGLRLPVGLMGCAPDLDAYLAIGDRRAAAPRRSRPGKSAPFTFLHVSSCFPRKGVDALLAAYAKAFRRGDPVRLVIKGFPNQHNDVAKQIAQLRRRSPDLPEIDLINRDLPPGQIAELYAAADAMVLPTRGEGFNMPAAEALAAGLPLIVTGHGGQVDFAGPEVARQVDYRFAPSLSHVQTYGSVWADPDVADLAAAMRECFEASGEEPAAKTIAAQVERGRAAARALGDGASWARRVREIAIDLLLLGPRDKPIAPKVAWVTTWNIRCGVATHSSYLLNPYPDASRDVTVLCDERTPHEDLDGRDGPRVRKAWRFDDPAVADRLASEIAATGAQVIVVQHQPGLIAWRALAQLLQDRRLAGRQTVIVLHNLAELEHHSDREPMLDALTGVTRAIVHNVRDLNYLKERGLIENVTLLPPGALPPRVGRAPTRELPRSASPLIGAYGFVTPQKGYDVLIRALAQLRGDWPGARLRMVTAEYPNEECAAALDNCRSLARSLGVAEAIEWHTDYLPDERSLELLNSCDLLVLPHRQTSEAASGAVRVAMASRVPVLVTPVAIFDDLSDAVIRAPGMDADALADAIAGALRDRNLRRTTVDEAERWLEAHDWARMSERLYGMICGLVTNRDAAGSGGSAPESVVPDA